MGIGPESIPEHVSNEQRSSVFLRRKSSVKPRRKHPSQLGAETMTRNGKVRISTYLDRGHSCREEGRQRRSWGLCFDACQPTRSMNSSEHPCCEARVERFCRQDKSRALAAPGLTKSNSGGLRGAEGARTPSADPIKMQSTQCRNALTLQGPEERLLVYHRHRH